MWKAAVDGAIPISLATSVTPRPCGPRRRSSSSRTGHETARAILISGSTFIRAVSKEVRRSRVVSGTWSLCGSDPSFPRTEQPAREGRDFSPASDRSYTAWRPRVSARRVRGDRRRWSPPSSGRTRSTTSRPTSRSRTSPAPTPGWRRGDDGDGALSGGTPEGDGEDIKTEVFGDERLA